ncbi:hypothetical protein E2562_010155 [Oryza meyeriana var. granulata]|uniref:Uncharacterized protein n=1 Tax=Oryza meyeriana var. granulata TaxID=110450 RepID=A0A6G1EI85_9ORYZ|nr:hypothetical protein E2562_010155 [Oryza meyeriana var. granulata]
MVEDEGTRDKINAQAMDYEYLRGNAFSNKLAKQNLESMSPRCRGCECDLTWDLVDEAVGASQSLHGRTFPRRAHNKRARNSVPTTVQEELGSENEEEEEIQDPYDDADVTDCEDDHNDANGGGEEEAANILGEFDDGY